MIAGKMMHPDTLLNITHWGQSALIRIGSERFIITKNNNSIIQFAGPNSNTRYFYNLHVFCKMIVKKYNINNDQYINIKREFCLYNNTTIILIYTAHINNNDVIRNQYIIYKLNNIWTLDNINKTIQFNNISHIINYCKEQLEMDNERISNLEICLLKIL